jgi:hypothetical protein
MTPAGLPHDPAAAFDGDAFHDPIAAHAATEVGHSDPRESFGVIMCPLAVLASVAVVGFLVAVWP